MSVVVQTAGKGLDPAASTAVRAVPSPENEKQVEEGGTSVVTAGASTAVTMLPSPTGLSHYRTEVTVVTHLVPDTSPITPCTSTVTVCRVNEINNSTTSAAPEQHPL